MSIFKNINISDFDYFLDDKKIAVYPLPHRDASKLLVYNRGDISTDSFYNIKKYISKDSLLIFNNTKVIRARLKFRKPTGAGIEIFCLEPFSPSDYQLSLGSTTGCSWVCLIGNAKKWKTSVISKKVELNGKLIEIIAEKTGLSGNNQILKFSWDDNSVSFGEILNSGGLMPIPPYLNRDSEAVDLDRYQTIYSKTGGSVAAPTAGLHFTDNVVNGLKQNGVDINELTLHVGAGTFRPVLTEKVSEHNMHTEHFFVDRGLIKRMIVAKGKIVAVGTTSVRALESIYFIGLKILYNEPDFHISQFYPYMCKYDVPVSESLQAIISYMDKNKMEKITASTQIMIVPGYKFRITDILITNFHQPRSTLLLLVSAFVKEDWRKIYKYAVENNFRFLSYGDSSILIP